MQKLDTIGLSIRPPVPSQPGNIALPIFSHLPHAGVTELGVRISTDLRFLNWDDGTEIGEARLEFGNGESTQILLYLVYCA